MVLPMTILENVKELLGNPKNIDDKLNVIIELTQKRLGNLLSVKEVPEELEYIVVKPLKVASMIKIQVIMEMILSSKKN